MNQILSYILGIDAPSGATFVSLEPMPVYSLIIIALIASALFLTFSFRLYRAEQIKLPNRIQIYALLSRSAAIFAFSMLFFQPLSCNLKLNGSRQSPNILILDDSLSMQSRDTRILTEDIERAEALVGKFPSLEPSTNPTESFIDGVKYPSRLELAKAILKDNPNGFLKTLESKGPLKKYLLGNDLKRTSEKSIESTFLEEWTGNQQRTLLSESIEKIIATTTEPPASLVIFTDGRDTGNNANLNEISKIAGEKNIPIFFIGLGLGQPASIELRDFVLPEIIQAGELLGVPIRWKLSKFDVENNPGAKVELKLTLDGVEVAKDTIPAKPGEDIRHALMFRPPFSGLTKENSEVKVFAKLIGIPNASGEDSLSKSLKIIDRKIKVLVIDKAPRWDLRFLLMNLTRETASSGGEGKPRKALDPKFVILEGDSDLTSKDPFLQEIPSTRKDLFAYDVIILGDIPLDKLGADGTERIRQFCEEGGGVLILAGKRYNNQGWNDSPLGNLLPIEPGTYETISLNEKRTNAFNPLLTRDGLTQEAMRLADTPDANFRIWKDLPGIFWHAPVSKLKPGATPLLVHPTNKTPTGPLPLIATQPYGRGQVGWFGFDEAWRWRYNDGDAVYGRFWSQWVYWAAGPRVGAIKQIRISIDRPDPFLNSSGQISVRALDKNFLPEKKDSISAKIEWLDAPENTEPKIKSREIELKKIPDKAGEFLLNLPHDKVGKFSLVIQGEQESRVEWRVFPPQDNEKGGLAESQLTEAARLSNGKFVLENNADKILPEITTKYFQVTFNSEIPRLNPLLFIILTIGLSLEWFFRRWNNLS